MDGFKKKGSFTVEAVFVVPVCLLVVFFLLQTFFYLHHISWYTAAAWECALTGMQEEGPQKESAQQRWQKIREEQPFPIAEVREAEQNKKLRIQVTIRGSQAEVMGLSALPFDVVAKRSWQFPAKMLRRQKQLRQLVDTGGEE